jgi:multicomponent Na+:H+ antiporter subunit G
MTYLLTLIAYLFIVSGLFFITSGVLGVFRMPDVLTKIHAAGLIDSIGLPLCFFGLSIMQESIASFVKIILMIPLFWILGPVSSHAIAKAAWKRQNSNR